MKDTHSKGKRKPFFTEGEKKRLIRSAFDRVSSGRMSVEEYDNLRRDLKEV